MASRNITVLGGGLAGLSSAFHLSRRFPSSHITLLEKQTRLGGWVRSERVQIPISPNANATPANVVIEAGPRTLRPNSKSVLELIHLLDLSPSVITTSKSSPAARSRFLHVPSLGPGLLPVPSSLRQLVSSPLAFLLISSVLRDFVLPRNLPRENVEEGYADESVDAFLSRRFGSEFARVFGSALVHGVYAADARNLSIRAGFKGLWEIAQEKGWGGLGRGLVRRAFGRKTDAHGEEYQLGNAEQSMKDVAVYSFKDGMQTLTDALERWLEARPNISILRGEPVQSLHIVDDGSHSLLVKTPNRVLTPTHVASCLPLPVLHTLLPPAQCPPHLTANKASSVMVLNLVFDRPNREIHPPGFGYLVPRAVRGYSGEDLGILGTVFDSCSLAEQDVVPPSSSGITKLTVMLGGPYLSRSPSPSIPSPGLKQFTQRDLNNVLKALSVQLGRSSPLPDPVFWHAWENTECIPVLGVGHLGRMKEMREALDRLGWGGRLEVVGAGVGGVSVGDCVEAGREVGRKW